jgi:drug/metabolite transporter (DMT)-like permease
MKLHLYTIIPAALLVVLQFIPVIRHKLILFHRMSGYIVVILSLISNAGTIIITKHAFGGDFATQTWTGAMVILTTVGYIMAWINIKLLQIDQHRAWMLRTWAWVCLSIFSGTSRQICQLY